MKKERQIDCCLGLQIRRQRQQTGKTLSEAAQAIGISPSLLSQIERGIVNPSISTLRAIADYLKTSIGVLLGERITEEHVRVVRKNERARSAARAKGLRFSILPPSNSKLGFSYREYEPGFCTGNKPHQHEGEECLFVLKGKLEMTVADKKFILEQGDFIWFFSTVPHRSKNLAKEKSTAILASAPSGT